MAIGKLPDSEHVSDLYGDFRDISEHMVGPPLLLAPSVSLTVLSRLDW